MPKSWNAHRIQFLTQGEMCDLLGAIPTRRDRALFLVAYRHGLRASEVGLLQMEDLDLEHYRLRVHRVKKSLSGIHPLQPDEVKALRAYLRTRNAHSPPVLFPSRFAQAISRRQLDHLMKRYGAAAGIPE